MDVESGYESPIQLKPSSGVSVHEADVALRLGKYVQRCCIYNRLTCNYL